MTVSALGYIQTYKGSHQFSSVNLIDLSPPSDWQTSLDNQRTRTNTPPHTISKACGPLVFENNSVALWGCADRTVSSNTHVVIYFACLSGRSYLSPGERSIVLKKSMRFYQELFYTDLKWILLRDTGYMLVLMNCILAFIKLTLPTVQHILKRTVPVLSKTRPHTSEKQKRQRSRSAWKKHDTARWKWLIPGTNDGTMNHSSSWPHHKQ